MRRLTATVVVLAALTACNNGSSRPTTAPTSPTSSTATPSKTPTAHSSGPTLAAQADEWPMYHHDGTRSGYNPLTPAVRGPLRLAWRVRLDGATYAEPLVVNGTFIVATEHNFVYGIRDGRVTWRSKQLGPPVSLSSLPCGNIDPIGITGTPAYDATTKSLFVVAEQSGPVHRLYALDPSTGRARWSRGVDPPNSTPAAQQQRAALVVVGGRVWVALGGLNGDCGPYHGYVVGIRTNGAGAETIYTVPTGRQGGIWAPGGPAVVGNDLYVSVGNGSSTDSSNYDGSDSVIRLNNGRRLSYFAPANWAQENSGDIDLGSTGPLVVGRFVVAAGKDGRMYVLNRTNLGGIGGQVSDSSLCGSVYGGVAVLGQVVYAPCTDGVVAVRVAGNGSLHRLWQAEPHGSPVVGGGRVWSVSGGSLYSLNPSTGRAVDVVSVGDASRFTTPTLHGRFVVVGTLSELVAYSF